MLKFYDSNINIYKILKYLGIAYFKLRKYEKSIIFFKKSISILKLKKWLGVGKIKNKKPFKFN